MKWYQKFHTQQKFTKPPGRKNNLLPFLQQNPHICTSMQQYGWEHLADLSIELMSEYVHDMIIPQMVWQQMSDHSAPAQDERLQFVDNNQPSNSMT